MLNLSEEVLSAVDILDLSIVLITLLQNNEFNVLLKKQVINRLAGLNLQFYFE